MGTISFVGTCLDVANQMKIPKALRNDDIQLSLTHLKDVYKRVKYLMICWYIKEQHSEEKHF